MAEVDIPRVNRLKAQKRDVGEISAGQKPNVTHVKVGLDGTQFGSFAEMLFHTGMANPTIKMSDIWHNKVFRRYYCKYTVSR